MTAHSNCTHPATKAARATCRRQNDACRSQLTRTTNAEAGITAEYHQLAEELAEMGTSPDMLAEARYHMIRDDLEAGDISICVKVPSYHEVMISRELAARLIGFRF